MAKYFYRRGQKVPVDEVHGVVGVQVDSAASAGVARDAIGGAVDGARAAVFAQPVPAEELAALSAVPRHFVWKETSTMPAGSRARWACGQVACRPVHMSIGRC